MSDIHHIGDLIPDPRNARKHTPRNVGMVEKALREVGAARSIVIDEDGKILAGNATIEAAAIAGIENVQVVEADGNTIIAVRRSGLTDAQKTKLALYDNRSAELAEWEPEVIAAIALEDDGALDGLFSGDELADIVGDLLNEPAEDPGAQIDKAAELQEKWQTACGQLWEIPSLATPGRAHRLLCGDSTSTEDVGRLMGGAKATLLFTDPPYGVGLGGKNRLLNSVQPSGRCLTDIEDDTLSPEELKARLLPAFKTIRQVLADDCSVFVCAPQGGELGMMMMMMAEAKLPPRHVLVWKKNAPTFSLGRLDYDYQHEPILFTWVKTHKRVHGGEHRTSVWEVAKPRTSAEHPTMKPVELPINAMLNHTERGDITVDIYHGSGTTMVAAEQTGRICYSMEIEPKYVGVALERMAGMGLTPALNLG